MVKICIVVLLADYFLALEEDLCFGDFQALAGAGAGAGEGTMVGEETGVDK